MPGASPSSCALSAVMRERSTPASPRTSVTCTSAPVACSVSTRQGSWLRMLVRSARAPAPGASAPARASTCSRDLAISPATSSNCTAAGVSRAPPPPLPPTVRSTSGMPARLDSMSSACHAAL